MRSQTPDRYRDVGFSEVLAPNFDPRNVIAKPEAAPLRPYEAESREICPSDAGSKPMH